MSGLYLWVTKNATKKTNGCDAVDKGEKKMLCVRIKNDLFWWIQNWDNIKLSL